MLVITLALSVQLKGNISNETNFFERTNEDFRNKTDEHHHIGETILAQISGLDQVSLVPLDYMYLVLLGVVKKL